MTSLIVGAIVSIVAAFGLTLIDAAIGSASRVAAEEADSEGRRGAPALREILADSAGPISVIAFLRAVAEAVAAVLITLVVVDQVERTWLALLVSAAIMVVVTFVLVGVSPRTLGRQHSTAIALATAPFVIWMRRLLGPVARLLVTFGNAVTPGRGYRDGPFRSEAELRDLLDLAGESAIIEDEERDMLHSVFELGDTLAGEVMVPRTDMITIESDKPARKALNLFIRSGFSRVPVVGDDTDDIVGLLYLKDVVRQVLADERSSGRAVEDFMRPAPFVPESKPVDELLREMQRDQIHAAIVVDEYGGTAGLVTIEDILEEIVGEITDEYDREGPGIEDLGDGRHRVPAGMHVDDLGELYGVDLDDEEVDTVGGLIGKVTGRVPIIGARAEVAGLSLTAEKMSGRQHRIATVIVEPLAADATGGHEQEEIGA
ncbi:hemolysin family protein [Janibacter terrae]|uniref:Hemolysin family protein n=1 Tax=Janibacter terrae TaxID=103817 RepID=A0ABZ2FDR4_9MICO|nr:hemolysin family protein [Janibacter terrae]MBA4085884.1 HlyC/CorC family transporter [Kytococcus sp.]HBO54006.1 HlyC/CorC family transporter [Janibacter terrae]